MTDEEKKDETSESSEEKSEETKEDAKSEESTEDKTKEETKEEATDSTKEIDWKAKHDEEKAKADAADKALADDRYKQDEARRKAEEAAEASGEEEEEKPLTKADFQAERAKDRQAMLKEARTVEAQSIVKGMTDNVDEQNYVLELHKNRTFPEHLSLKEQLEESFAIANKDKWKGERDEALRKAKGDEGANKDAATSHRKSPESKAGEPSMSAEDKQSLVAKGWKWNTTNRRYEKTTGSGILLFRDPDTGSVKTAK